MLAFWNFEPLNFLKSSLMPLVCIPEVLTHLLTPILPYIDIANVGYQMRHLCQKCQKCHIWRLCHTHCVILNMAIWVSKDASGPREWRPMPLNNLLISLTTQNFKILTFEIFLCIFKNFLCIILGARGGWNIRGRRLKFFLVTPDTQCNGKKHWANSESNFLVFRPPLTGIPLKFKGFPRASP